MISERDSFSLRHQGGKFLAFLWAPNSSTSIFAPSGPPPYGGTVFKLVDSPLLASTDRSPAAVERWLFDSQMRAQFETVPAPVCACCGSWDVLRLSGDPRWPRCAKHRDRNPCAIEGCERTTAAPNGWLGNDTWFCGAHWRAYVPPRSLRRRAYHAFWRRAKREARSGGDGWSPELRTKFRRFWNQLVASARQRHGGGFLDVAEIDRMFGFQ